MKTTIPIESETRERLRKFGVKGESWDTLLNRIIDKLERKEKNEA